MKIAYSLFLLLLLLVQASLAQQVFGPEKLSAAINSPYPEINPILSPDGKTLFFVRLNHPENTFGTHDTQDIWYSEKQQDGSWSEARRMPEHLNKNRYNAVFGVFNQGNTLLLHGHYNKRGTIWKKRGFSLSQKTKSGWSIPQPMKVKKLAKKSKGLYTSATISDNGQYLLLSFCKRYNSPKSQMYISRKNENGTYGKPKKLKGLNNGGWNEAPFLSPDGKTLYYTSNFTGNYQVYGSERLDETGRAWTSPTPMNDSINTMAWESYFRTDFEGNYGYFARKKEKAEADIYRIKLIDSRPHILVKGRVWSPVSQPPLGSTIQVSFYANQEEVDSVVYDPADGSYQIFLPPGKQYELKAVALNHQHKVEHIDGTNWIGFTEIEKDLYLEPTLGARIEGQLLNSSSNTPLPATIKPQILVNEKAPDSFHIDPITYKYHLWLPYEKDYQVQAPGKPEVDKKTELDHSLNRRVELINLEIIK